MKKIILLFAAMIVAATTWGQTGTDGANDICLSGGLFFARNLQGDTIWYANGLMCETNWSSTTMESDCFQATYCYTREADGLINIYRKRNIYVWSEASGLTATEQRLLMDSGYGDVWAYENSSVVESSTDLLNPQIRIYASAKKAIYLWENPRIMLTIENENAGTSLESVLSKQYGAANKFPAGTRFTITTDDPTLLKKDMQFASQSASTPPVVVDLVGGTSDYSRGACNYLTMTDNMMSFVLPNETPIVSFIVEFYVYEEGNTPVKDESLYKELMESVNVLEMDVNTALGRMTGMESWHTAYASELMNGVYLEGLRMDIQTYADAGTLAENESYIRTMLADKRTKYELIVNAYDKTVADINVYGTYTSFYPEGGIVIASIYGEIHEYRNGDTGKYYLDKEYTIEKNYYVQIDEKGNYVIYYSFELNGETKSDMETSIMGYAVSYNDYYGITGGGGTTEAIPVTSFYESFNACNAQGGNDGLFNNISGTPEVKSDYTWTVENAYGANQCIRVGSSKSAGKVITPVIAGSPEGVTTLSFTAAPWSSSSTTTSSETKLMIWMYSTDGEMMFNFDVLLEPGAMKTYTVQLPNASYNNPNFRLTFTTPEGSSNTRFFLDEVKTSVRPVETCGAYGMILYEEEDKTIPSFQIDTTKAKKTFFLNEGEFGADGSFYASYEYCYGWGLADEQGTAYIFGHNAQDFSNMEVVFKGTGMVVPIGDYDQFLALKNASNDDQLRKENEEVYETLTGLYDEVVALGDGYMREMEKEEVYTDVADEYIRQLKHKMDSLDGILYMMQDLLDSLALVDAQYNIIGMINAKRGEINTVWTYYQQALREAIANKEALRDANKQLFDSLHNELNYFYQEWQRCQDSLLLLGSGHPVIYSQFVKEFERVQMHVQNISQSMSEELEALTLIDNRDYYYSNISRAMDNMQQLMASFHEAIAKAIEEDQKMEDENGTIFDAVKAAEREVMQALDSTKQVIENLFMETILFDEQFDNITHSSVHIPGIAIARERSLNLWNDCHDAAMQAMADSVIIAMKDELLVRINNTTKYMTTLQNKIYVNIEAYDSAQVKYNALGQLITTVANATIYNESYMLAYAKLVNQYTELLAPVYAEYENYSDTLALYNANLLFDEVDYMSPIDKIRKFMEQFNGNFTLSKEEAAAAALLAEHVDLDALHEAWEVVTGGDLSFTHVDEKDAENTMVFTASSATSGVSSTEVQPGGSLAIESQTMLTTLTFEVPADLVSTITASTGSIHVESPVAQAMRRSMSKVAPIPTRTVTWTGEAYNVQFYVPDSEPAPFEFVDVNVDCEPIPVTMEVNFEWKWNTFICPFEVGIDNKNVDAYIVTGVEEVGTTGKYVVTKTVVKDVIPANTPVLLHAEDGLATVVSGVAKGPKPLYKAGALNGSSTEEPEFDEGYILNLDFRTGETTFQHANNGSAMDYSAYLAYGLVAEVIHINATDIYSSEIAEYNEYRNGVVEDAEDKVLSTDTDPIRTTIEAAVTELKAREYVTVMTLEANEEALDDIYDAMSLSVAKQRAINRLHEAAGQNPSAAISDIVAAYAKSINNAGSEILVNYYLNQALIEILNAQQNISTSLDEMEQGGTQLYKSLENGMLYIIRAGKRYSVMGETVE